MTGILPNSPSPSMPQVTPRTAAAVLRDAVAALSHRLATDFGDLVPDASVERTAAVVAKLERLADGATAPASAGLTAEDATTLDSWIRLADSAMLHDDPAEARARAGLGDRLRAVRALAVPDGARLTEDPRTA